MKHSRLLALVIAGATALCLIGLRGARGQSSGLRRVTNTSEEGTSINPSISGDGRILAFESTEDIAGAGGVDHFRAIRANIATEPPAFFQVSGTRAVAPAISQDGSHIAFASKDDPLGANLDGNSEIFLFDGAKLIQVTTTSPGDIADRVRNGNFQPSISDDGRFIAFSSNRDLVGQNSDGNLEIFIYDTIAASFTQLTSTSGIVGSSDAKISGNGGSVAYIRDTGSTPSLKRDLLEQSRAGSGPATLLASNVQSLTMTFGRALSDDGTRVVYSAETATNSTQAFLFDSRAGAMTRQVTSLGVRTAEVPLHPTISGDGLRIAFATRRSVNGTNSNSDGSVELYVFDIPSSQVSRITNAPASATADVVSSLSDDGSIVAFSFPRILSGPLANSEFANESEVYVTATPPRPAFGTLTVLNGASFGKEPSTTKAVAPDSIAVASGGALANSTQQSQRLPNGTFPTNVGGTTVMVNGRPAQILFISPSQVNFLVPAQTEIGAAEVSIANSENFTSRGTVPILRVAPGVFTQSGDGTGPGVILNSETLQEGSFDPTNGNLRLTVFTTGVRNATQTVVSMGGRLVNAETVISSPDMPGLDEVHVLVPKDLRGAGTADLFVQSDGRGSNPVAVTFLGEASRDILINEMLSDPPGAVATDVSGDANHDGVRSSIDDEFVELVNTTTHDIDISGYQLLTRSSSTTTDTLRHTFAASTILPACTAIVVFGGGSFEATNPVFGGSKVVKVSSGDLSLSNTGGVVTLRDQASGIASLLAYGGSTGLSGSAGQSLTRSPDQTGSFVLHQTANGSRGSSFSPGTKADGSAFTACNPFVRIDVSPASAAIDAGAKQQFTANAFDANGNGVSGVIFSWQSSNTSVATVDQNGLATSSTPGLTEVRAFAHGIQSAPATLTVREVQQVLALIEVTPQSATIPASGAQRFTARGIDQFGNTVPGLTFAWESSNANAATIDQTGLASGISQGQSTIKATSQNVSGTATLNVTAPTVVVNEVLADPPTGTDGDANHDGSRDSSQDEFVELVNSTNGSINISSWTLRTHSTTTLTETVRHTFPANTTLPAGEAMIVFGGGTFSATDPLFGCAQAVKASSGGLSLTNTGLTILVRDGAGNLITQFSYGGATGLNGGNAQSLTRSPDITGNFVLHTTAASAAGRKLSAGLKLDGTPFGNCPGHPATVTMAPISATINVGETMQFTGQAFDQFGRAMIGVAITFASDNATVATVDSVTTNPSTGVATATVSAHNPGTAHINASATDGTTTASSAQATVTVNGPSLTINDVSANEGNSGTSTFTFTVSLSMPAPLGGVAFNIATQDNTASSANNDYVAHGLTGQTIAAGQSTYTFDVTINGDVNIEPNETFFVNVTNVSGASIQDGQGVGTIRNDDSPVLSITPPVSVAEGNTGPTAATFTVTLSPSSNQTVTVDYATANGTANAGTDYVATNGTLTFNPLETSKPISVTVNGDILVEPDETFSVSLSNPSANASISETQGMGTATITNDDTPLIVISQIYGGGGNSGAPYKNDFIEIFNRGTSTVSLSGYSVQYAGDSAATWSKTDLTNLILAPGKYYLVQEAQGAGGASSLPAPDATGSIAMATASGKVALVNSTTLLSGACPSSFSMIDLIGYGSTSSCFEGTARASAPSNTTADLRKGGGCVDTNDNAADFFVHPPAPRNSNSPANTCSGQTADIAISDVTVTEGNGGAVSATFTVSLIAASATTVTVDYATADGTANAPGDYQAISTNTLTFNPGDLSRTVTVLVNGDTLDEPDETFFVNLTNATNAAILDNQGQATITDDDVPPSLTINSVARNEGNSGPATFAFTVHLSAPALTGGVTFDIATADGTAQDHNPISEDNDYVGQNFAAVTIPAGSQDYLFNVTVNGDASIEADETFFVNVTNVVGATVVVSQGQGTIQNDDSPSLSIDDVTDTEGNSGTTIATFSVTLAPPSGETVTVDYATSSASPATAAAGTDYVAIPANTLTFLPGETTKTINVTVNGDTTNEAICETYFVNLTNPVNAAISDNQGLGGITDDDGSKLVISQIYGGGNNSGATFQNDFVEIFNRGATTVDFGATAYSVQYASAAGTFSAGNTINLTSGTVAPGQYFLIKLAPATPAIGAALPPADATNTSINMSATDGKVALVLGTTILSGSGCPFSAAVADFIGYGSANCSETSGIASLSATKSARRTASCTDTNSNSADFSVVTNPSAPRNKATALAPCSCTTSYASLFMLSGESWKATLAKLLVW